MANNRDIMRLLTGIPSQGISPLSALTPQQMRAQAVQGGIDAMSRGMRGMFTGDRRTPQQKQQEEMLKQLSAQKQQAKIAEDARREKLIETARSLGLDLTVDLLQNNGSMTEALEQIRKAQEADVLKKQGRKGKIAIANNRNVGAPMLKSIGQGDYDSLSNEEFLKVLQGEKAELKVYTDSNGVSKPFRVNESGKVYDAKNEKWAMPSELGLTQAAQVTKTISDADKLAGKLRDKAADNFFVANEKARNAEKVLQINANSRSLMEEGIITGAGANFLAGMASIGVQLGFVPKGVEDKLIATQTFMAERGKQVLALLGSGDVGAGTGISDKDVQFLKEIAAGAISLDLLNVCSLS